MANTEPPQRQEVVVDPAATRQVIVRVGHRTLTRAYLEQWTPLEVLLASRYRTSSALPAGFVPDPPGYSKCVSYLASTAAAGGAAAKPSAEQLKSQCEHEHQTQEQSTLTHLLKFLWLYEEAAKRGITVSRADVRREVAATSVKPAVIEALGVPPAYHEFSVKAEMITAKIERTLPVYRKLLKGVYETPKLANEVDNENARFYNGLLGKWGPRTHCDPEFIVWGCSEYAAESQGGL